MLDEIILSSSTVNVPINFAGMQVIKAVSATNFNSSIARNWDQLNAASGSAAVVKYLNPSSGVFDWTVLDRFISNNLGKQILFTLGQPADWMIPSRSALGGANYGGKANAALPPFLKTIKLIKV